MFTLVLSSLASQVDQNIESEVVYAVVEASLIEYFQNGHGCDENIQVVFVESTPSKVAIPSCKNALESIRQHANGHFLVIEGEWSPAITQLVTSGLINAEDMTAIVNPSNHRLSSKGGYTNQLIHGAIGPGTCSLIYFKCAVADFIHCRIGTNFTLTSTGSEWSRTQSTTGVHSSFEREQSFSLAGNVQTQFTAAITTITTCTLTGRLSSCDSSRQPKSESQSSPLRGESRQGQSCSTRVISTYT
jgi:hypothetical protein